MEPEGFQRTRGIAFDCGRNGPARLSAAHVDALKEAGGAPAALKSRPADAAKGQARARSAWQKVEIAKWWPTIEAATVKVV
jgi:hypothetical protein